MSQISKINSLDSCFLDVHRKLKKFFENGPMYPDFPQIPDSIRDENRLLNISFSIYKKGASYYLVNDENSEYIETGDSISHLPIVFFFTEDDLSSPHVGLDFSERTQQLLENPSEEIQYYEDLLNYVVFKGNFHIFSPQVRDKLVSIQGDMKPSNYKDSVGSVSPMMYVFERITLFIYHGLYVVWLSDIHFTESELGEIKKLTVR